MKFWLSLEAGCILIGGMVILLMPHVPAPAIVLHPLVPQAWVDRVSLVYLAILTLILGARIVSELRYTHWWEERVFRREVRKSLKRHGLKGSWKGKQFIVKAATPDQVEAVTRQLREGGWL